MTPAARTEAVASRPEVHDHQPYQPSRRALATRSWEQVRRLTGSARAEATARHFAEFAPMTGAACRP